MGTTTDSAQREQFFVEVTRWERSSTFEEIVSHEATLNSD
jgi:hypothetical protein